jgi:hypothetical protein
MGSESIDHLGVKKPDGRSRAARQWRKAYQKRFFKYFEALHHCYRMRLTDDERRAYDEWEAGGWEKSYPGQNYPGDTAWPGWRKYIGPPPWEGVKQ